MIYHVYIELKDPKGESETKLGLTEQQLTDRILQPHDEGRAFVVNGRTIAPSNIDKIRVSRGTEAVERLLARAEAEERNSPVVFIGGRDLKPYLAFAGCEDVTDDFILGPPGYRSASKPSGVYKSDVAACRRVFVAHGHDHGLKNAVGRYIKELGLEPIILHERPDQGQTVIEKFEREAVVGFAVVLCTADDLAESERVLEAQLGDPDKPVLRRRARQNVVFELGYFVGRIGRSRVAIVVDSGVQIPSDLSGVIYVERSDWSRRLWTALRDAGYEFTTEQTRLALALET